jgi:hypothetical protein
MTILSLKSYPDMRAAFAATEKLSAQFKAVHKRGEKVELYLASSGDPKSPFIEVRCHYAREHEADARWLAEAIKSI